MKTFKYFLTLLFCILNLAAFAEDVAVEVNPPEPVMNESFFVTFKIKATGDSDPYVSFTPSGAQVLGKREQGVSISTVVINGKFTTTKEQNIVYELVSERSGMVTLRNINVDLNGKPTKVKDVHINILSQPKKTPEAFMEAQVSKTKVYVGEGIDVNYYLYFKSSISANDVKDFPKLNKFIKRFHHINSPVETVQYKNEVLKRILAYSARIYPEKAGTAVIDPMRISVQVVENSYNGFGFGTQAYKNKELASQRVEIEVLPLPTENVPAGFTGLVGEHEFNLYPAKNKFLVNEPIELKLEVSGKGALEKMEAPGIYSDQNLETFDTKADVTETGNSSAKKVFEYTYLARNALSIKDREMPLAYFDPSTGKYVEKKIKVPGIEVSGTAVAGSSGKPTPKAETTEAKSNNSDPIGDFFNRFLSPSKDKGAKSGPVEIGLVGPKFKSSNFFSSSFLNIFNLVLLVMILVIGYFVVRSQSDEVVVVQSSNKEAKILLKRIKSKGLSYSDLYKFLAFLDHKNLMASGGVSLSDVIMKSELSNEAKLYFKNALESCESNIYSDKKNEVKFKYESKYFSEVLSKV